MLKDRIILTVPPTGLEPDEEEAIVQALEGDAAESWRAVNTNASLNLNAVSDRDRDL